MKRTLELSKPPTAHFQALCDAAMDLDPQALAALKTITPREGAHLIALADAAIVRETTAAARRMTEMVHLKEKAPIDAIAPIAAAHHDALFRYTAIRALIFGEGGEDGEYGESDDLLDIAIF